MNNIEIAILGLLTERAMHGYELDAVVEDRGMRNWTEIGFSSIYSTFKKLEKREFVESRIEYGETLPPRKIYEVTEKGAGEFRKEVKRILSSPKRPVSEFDLGIANIWCVSREEAVSSLESYIKKLKKEKKELEELWIRQGGERLPFFVAALFTRPMTHIGAELEWAEKFIGIVKSRKDWGGGKRID